MAKKSTLKKFGPGLSMLNTEFAIGIDQSYSGFGITFMEINGSGWETIVFKGESTGVDRLVYINNMLADLVGNRIIRAKEVKVAMEGYAFGSQMANMAGELGAVVKIFCWNTFSQWHGKYPYIIPPTVLKKYVTGKGSGIQKNQMLLHVFKKWGAEFTDDNAADSYALAHMAAGKCELSYEREIYHNIQDPKYREK
jgi:crossover junction endodeoxyribonuclease RuvC